LKADSLGWIGVSAFGDSSRYWLSKNSSTYWLSKNKVIASPPYGFEDALPAASSGWAPNPGAWISNSGLVYPSEEGLANLYGSSGWTVQFNRVPFDMKDFGLSEGSRDGMRIFRLEGRVIHHWRFGGIKDDANQKAIEYDYQFGKQSDLQEAPSRLTISADGSCVAVANDRELQYSSFPFEEWKKIPLDLQPGDSISALRWSDYATRIAIGMSSGDLLLYDPGIEKFQTVARAEPGPINDLLYLPDEKTLATAHDSGAVIVWDLEQKEVRLSINAHRGKVNTLEYDNVSHSLYSGGDDGAIRRWASSTYANRVLVESFQTPKSTDPILEKRSEKSSDELQNRELAKWLTAKGIQIAAMSFGVPREIDLSDESIDEFAICSVSSRDPTKITDEVVEKLAALKELKKLDLSNSKITSKCFSFIENFTGLAWLDLSGIDLTDFDFRKLKCSQSLRTLALNGCNLQDYQLLQIIANSPHLLDLSLSANHISQASIENISSLKSLKSLNIASSKLDEHAILSMKQLSQLEKLVVDDTHLTKEHLVQLLELKLIKEFSARRTEADDHWLGLSAKEPRTLLTTWNHITKLDLRDTQVTAVGVSQLLKHRSMISVLMDPSRFQSSVDLSILSRMGPIQGRIQVNGGWLYAGWAIEAMMRTKSARITGIVWPIDRNRSIEDLPHLKQLTQLRRIAVNKNVVPRIHYPLLCQLNQIKHLDLSGEPVIEEPSDYAHIGNMIQLESITIDRKISKERLKSMSKLQQIQSFTDNSSNPKVSVADIAETFPNLKNLVADNVDKNTLERALPSLQQLEIFEIKSGFKSNLGPILVRLPKLKVLDVHKSLTTNELKELKELLPNVEIKHRQ
jgi:WD40 repeat protein